MQFFSSLPGRTGAAFVLALALLFATPATAQPGLKNVPNAVRTSFAERFGPPAPSPTWDRERGGIWQAVFRDKSGAAASARFDSKGQWLETTRAVSAKELPAGARAYVVTNYPKKRIRGAALVTRADQTQRWKVNVEKDRLFFDNAGHLIRPTTSRSLAAEKAPRKGLMPRKGVKKSLQAESDLTQPALKVEPAQAER